jgi:HAD superfamily hydrolase (TIGR01459 family)
MLLLELRGWPGVASAMKIDGLGDIAGNFDGMLIDQFGVIHDGEKLYPGTLDVLKRLHEARLPVAIMTNSGKRAAVNRSRLLRMGIPRDWFVDAVSSGEVAYRQLIATDQGPGKGARKTYIIGKEGDTYGFDGIPVVSDLREAELLLILGSNAPRTSLDEYRQMLTGLKIPALCCNPDKLMLTPLGLQPAPGAIAALYEEMGGKVTWIGKPFRAIYDYALRLIGTPERVLCIGDSPEHDVAGGHNAGLKVLLVRTGVSAGLEHFDPEPDFIIDSFRW